MNRHPRFGLAIATAAVVTGVLTLSRLPNGAVSWASAAAWLPQTALAVAVPAETGAISGHVYEQNGVTPVVNAWITINILDQNDSVAHATTDEQGYYIANGLEARDDYKVQASADGYLSAFYPDQARWENAGVVPVSVGQTTSGTDIRLLKGDAYITGRVTYSDGTPVSDVWVEAFHTDGWFVGVSANANGEYRSPVIAGTWQIFPYQPPYLARSKNVTLVSGQTVSGIDFVLEAGGSISGHVYEQDGVTPVANACVNVSATAPEWNQIAGTCCTGSDGSFSITGVPVGRVYVRTHANCQNAHPDLSDEWHAVGGSTPDGSQASPVDVVAGQTTPGINFQLNRMTVVKGTIYNADGSQPIARAGIHYSPADNQGSYSSYCADDNGRFSISMPSGSYKFFARGDRRCGSDPNLAREYWSETTVWNQAEVITVTEETPVVREITFTLSLGGSIWGIVHDATSLHPVGGGLVGARSPDGLQSAFVCADDDGSYVIPGLLLGDYKVWARGWCRADANYILEYWQEKPNWETADVVTLSEAQRERQDIDFALLLGSRISGTVFRSDGITPITDTPIYITLYNATTGEVQTQTQAWQEDGSYGFPAFPSGAYRVKAWDPNGSGYFAEYYDNKPNEAQADLLNLTAGQTVSEVNFSLDRGAVVEVPSVTGATLVYTDTQSLTTIVQIPAAAVTETTTLVYTEVMTATTPSGFAFAGHAFDLAAYQDSQPLSGLVFNEPVTITVNYSDADVAGMDEATLQLNYWNGSAWSTDGITMVERDIAHNRFVATISHLSTFATFAEPRRMLYLPLIMRRAP